MDLKANIPMSLLSYPAEVNWLFPHRQADISRRRCKTFRERTPILDRSSLHVRSVIVKNFCTSIQCSGTIPLDGISIPCSSAPPQVETVVAVAVQAFQCELGDLRVIYCLLLHGSVIILQNWPQWSQRHIQSLLDLQHIVIGGTFFLVTRAWLMSIIGGYAFDISLQLLM